MTDLSPPAAPLAALRAAFEAVALEPRPDLATVVLTGSERVAWLNGLVTCELSGLGAGEGRYGLLLEKKGKIRSDLVAVALADALVLVVPEARRALVLEVLDHHLVMEDVELAPGAHRVVYAHGPRAEALAEAVPAAPGGVLGWWTDDRTGLGSRLALLEADAAGGALEGAVQALGGAVLDEGGAAALAVERFVPRLGLDFDDGFYPQEAALAGHAVSFAKGCYLGQEVVYMLEHRGREKQRLVRLALDAAGAGQAAAPGTEVRDASGAVVGTVKRSAAGLEGEVAIALVKRASAEPGTALVLGDDARGARVSPPAPR